MSQANVELVLRGYWAFVAGDLDTVADMLDPDIEWIVGRARGRRPDTRACLGILAERFDEGYRVEIERCVGIGDDVAVSFRVAGEERDASDDRPLQTRRYFTVGRYAAVVTVVDGRVVPRAGVPAPRGRARGARARRGGVTGAALVGCPPPSLAAASRPPTAARSANGLLHAMSDHVLIAPEGDSNRRRHAHTDCVARARAPARLRTYDDWRRERSRARASVPLGRRLG